MRCVPQPSSPVPQRALSARGAGVLGLLDRRGPDVGVQLEHQAAVRVSGGRIRDAAECAEPGASAQGARTPWPALKRRACRFRSLTASSSRRKTRTSRFRSCETSTSCWIRCMGIPPRVTQRRSSEALDRFAGAEPAGPKRQPDAVLERDAGCGAAVNRGAHVSACAAAVRVRSGACCSSRDAAHLPPQIRAATRRCGAADGKRRRGGRPSTPPGSKPSRLKRDMPSAPAMAWPYA